MTFTDEEIPEFKVLVTATLSTFLSIFNLPTMGQSVGFSIHTDSQNIKLPK